MIGTYIVIIDTETTGLDAPSPTKIELQPYITEFYGVRLTRDFKFISEVDTMVKPPVPISEEITKITGITQADVDSAPAFINVYDKIYDLFEGVNFIVGHNIMFDLRILTYELFRHDFQNKFHFPKHMMCTVELSKHYLNKRLTLQKLHEHLFGFEFVGAHRARSDVEATAKCFIEMVKRGEIDLENYK